MTYASLSTIAQLVCCPQTPVNFARMVGDLDAVLSRFGEAPRQLTWDCEDVAIFDLPGTRILLGWAEETGRGTACLSVGVGPSPLPPVPGTREGHDALCVRLVERVQARLSPQAVVWHQVEGLITAETIDSLIEALPRLDTLATDLAEMADAPPEAEIVPEPEKAAATAAEAKPAPEPEAKADKRGRSRPLPLARKAAKPVAQDDATANDQPDLPRPRDPELARLRAALYEPRETDLPEPPSAQMRLAVHAMNATLIVVYAPLGAAVMTYALLKGEDMKLSARLLMLTGSISMMVQTPLGQSMAAFVGT
jgi:hypothetical protein